MSETRRNERPKTSLSSSVTAFVVEGTTQEIQTHEFMGESQSVIRTGEGATGILFFHYHSDVPSHEMEIELEEHAHVILITLNQASGKVCTFTQRARLKTGSKLELINVSLGSTPLEHTFRSELHGADASSDLAWLSYAKGSEKQKLSARNVFLGERGGGEILMRAIAEDRAVIACDGMIEIGPKGNGTQTFLTQQVLMLDTTAKVDAVPGLEIHTNDVKASHSATVARITPEDLFTFAARGIPEAEARRMFIQGFLGDLVSRVPDESMRAQILSAIEEKYQ